MPSLTLLKIKNLNISDLNGTSLIKNLNLDVRKGIVNVIIGQKVQEARKKKARRLKQAKEEALIEIERFRSERENAFREYESKHMGSM